MNKFLEVFQDNAWLILPDSLKMLMNGIKQGDFGVTGEAVPESFKSFRKSDMDIGGAYEIIDKTAVIQMYGPIFPKSNFMTYLGYATSLVDLKNSFEKAEADTGVEQVLLVSHSPGGVVFGVNAFAEYLSGFSKKITTYVPGMCCSAAYWIASATDRIVVDSTAMVGSIGVVCTVVNPEKDDYYIEITNRKSPNKRPDPSTEEGKSVIQDELDALADVFIECVAENREVSVKTVEKDFGKGGVLIGKKAQLAGMVDSVDSLQGALEASFIRESSNDNNNIGEEDMENLKECFAKHPKLEKEYKEALENATKTAVENATKKTEASSGETDTAISAINSNISKLVESLSGLNNKVKQLEKQAAVREEKDMEKTANVIADSVLASFKLSGNIKKKVKKAVSYAEYVSEDGVFNSEEFKAAIETEAKEFKEAITGNLSIEGSSSSAEDPFIDDDESMAEEDIDALLAEINITTKGDE